MAIEGSINENTGLEKRQLPEPLNGPFHLNAPILAGTIKVIHPLMGKTELLIVGFVVEDADMTQENFAIRGTQISYQSARGIGKNRIIYTKMIIDNKRNNFSIYFKNDTEFKYRAAYSDSPFSYKKGISYGTLGYYYGRGNSHDEIEQEPHFEYYMYEKINSEIPECSANEVFALCKYRENGVFKYAIFNFFELKRPD